MANIIETKNQESKGLETGINKAFLAESDRFTFCSDEPEDPNEVLGVRSDFRTKEEAVQKMHQSDPVLAGLWYTLVARIIGLDTVIEKREGDKGEAQFIEEQFKAISNWMEKLKDILGAIQLGNSFTELLYIQDGFHWVLDGSLGGILVRPPSKFCFKQEANGLWQINYNPNDNWGISMNDCWNGIPLDPRKFKYMTYGAAYSNPHGQGIYNDVYNYWWLKREEVRLWGLLGEGYVFPKIIIMPEAGETLGEDDLEVIGKLLKKPLAAKGIRLNKKVIVEILNKNLQDPGKAYDNLINFCNLSIAYRLHGQGLAINEAAGSQAKEGVRMQLFNFLIDSYIMGLEYFINHEIIKQLCDLNFQNPVYPKWNIVRPEAADPKDWVEAMREAVKLGASIGKSWFEEKLGIPDVKEGEETLEAKESPRMQAFTEGIDGIERFLQDYQYLTQ
jgi:hypothetical protein